MWLDRRNYFELKATVEYHESQQRMVTTYFELWRQPPPDPLEGMRWALVPGMQVRGPSSEP